MYYKLTLLGEEYDLTNYFPMNLNSAPPQFGYESSASGIGSTLLVERRTKSHLMHSMYSFIFLSLIECTFPHRIQLVSV